LVINPPSGNFGSVKVGQKKSVTFTLSNSAQEGPPITFQSPVGFRVPVSTPQVFGFAGVATNCRLQLGPNKQCELTVEFIPAKRVLRSSLVTIYDNAANANQTIPLSGSGE
jgi:hypothetical protein